MSDEIARKRANAQRLMGKHRRSFEILEAHERATALDADQQPGTVWAAGRALDIEILGRYQICGYGKIASGAGVLVAPSRR